MLTERQKSILENPQLTFTVTNKNLTKKATVFQRFGTDYLTVSYCDSKT